MCGITGLIGHEPDETRLRRMLDVARRRGPEDARVARVPGALLGHAALKFVDIDNSEQPFIDRDGSAIVYNGEVYNWSYLNAIYRLGARNDTQTLLRGLRRLNVDFLRDVDGQFAFIALLDRGSDSEMILARDKWGICPLVFGHNPEGMLCVGSTPEAVEKAGVQNVKTVPAGAYALISPTGQVAFDYWWKLPRPSAECEPYEPQDILARCSNAVAVRIPEAAESLFTTMGGIDSQFITACVARRTGGRFGGAITVVPWHQRKPSDLTGGDFPHAHAMCQQLAEEGIHIKHHVAQLTPRYVDENIDRLARLLGPDLFNLSCAFAEDLVARTARRLGGKAVMTAGGPDEAGRSYKIWALRHRYSDQEQAWYEMGEQFAYSEGVRAGLVLGEHGIENRVPLADLIEMTVHMPPQKKHRILDYGDGTNPATIKMDDKIFWRQALADILPRESLSVEKATIHRATGAEATLFYVANNDEAYQAQRDTFARRAQQLQWSAIVFGNLLQLDPRNPVTECQLYALYRWSRVEPDLFERGGEYRYGPYVGGAPRFGHDVEERMKKPLCYDWQLGKEVILGHR